MNWKKITIIFVIIIIALFYGLSRGVVGPKRPFVKDSTFCKVDADCTLYNCTSCGNNHWIDIKDETPNEECTISVPGLIGCKCTESVCKRDYSN